MVTNSLLYFVKYPEPGKVKTRLAKGVGASEAAEIYRGLAEANLKELNSIIPHTTQLIVAFDPPEKKAEIEKWLSSLYEYVSQQGEDLGTRLQNAFKVAFKKGYEQVIALGSDTLGLKADLVTKAFDALERYDVVVGPAYDGGYYLIGMATPSPLSSPPKRGRGRGEGVLSIFKNIPWSSPHVFEATLNKLIEKNLSYYLLEKLDDLDERGNLNNLSFPHALSGNPLSGSPLSRG